MPRERIHFPETLPGAAKFSGDNSLNEEVALVRAFKEAKWISGPLMQHADALASPQGRRRMKGSWVLVAVAFIASRQGDIQPFHDRASEALWAECGFERRPSYSTTHDRLTELEALLPEIEEAIGDMVRAYIQMDPRIGRHIHIDGTEADTHSRFHHDCQEDDVCAWRRDGETIGDVNRRVLGVTAESAQKWRQQEDAGDVPAESDESARAVERTNHPTDGRGRRPLYRVETSKHRWLTHDPEAGFRSYRKPNGNLEGWHGYYHLRAVDDFTGLTIYGHTASSSRTEQSQYEDVLRGIARTMNPPERRGGLDDGDLTLTQALLGSDARLPEAILADKGFAYPFIYEQNTRLGILTVMPWRNIGGRAEATEIVVENRDGTRFTVDRHGVVHCKHCGGPTKHEELRRAKNENPRLYVRCLLPSASDSPCGKAQSVSCDLDWRMLLPTARNDERYLALETRFQFERVHHMGRVRNRNGAKDPILRPKRLGRAWQQLLLDLGSMVDWFRAGIKHGWLDAVGATFPGYPKKTDDKRREAKHRLQEQVAKRAEQLRIERQSAGLDTCLAPPKPERAPPKPGA